MAMLEFVVALVAVEGSTVALPDRVTLGPQGVVGVVVPVLQQVLHVRYKIKKRLLDKNWRYTGEVKESYNACSKI